MGGGSWPVGLLNGLAVLTMYAALARGPVTSSRLWLPAIRWQPSPSAASYSGSGGLGWRVGLGAGDHRRWRGLLLRA